MPSQAPVSKSVQSEAPAAPQAGPPKQRLTTDRERAIMQEMRTLQAAMRAAADDSSLNPMQRSAAIAGHRAKYLRKADELRLEAARGMAPQVGQAENLRQQIKSSKASVRQQLRDSSLTDQQRQEVAKRHVDFVREKAQKMQSGKLDDADEPFPY